VNDFYDTSILVAAFREDHPEHAASIKLLSQANKRRSACAVHSLAEFYAVMSVMPVRPVVPPEQILLFIQEIRDRCTVITLDENEYFDTIRATAESGFVSGRVYDALLLRCAVKSQAKTIYTWNLKHFHALAPELAAKIRAPQLMAPGSPLRQ
jgi:predicted nucleic acid-binding protein